MFVILNAFITFVNISLESFKMEPPSFTQAVPMSQLLPGLSGILTKDEIQSLTAKKKPRPTMAQSRVVGKTVRPLTIAEMRADLVALEPHSPRRNAQALCPPSSKKKGWNSSVKVDFKKINHTANGQLKNNPVRKVLNFQHPKPKIVNSRITMHTNLETPKFPKPEIRAKKSHLNLQAKNTVRISGICNIPQTPVESVKKTNFNVKRMTVMNKENVSNIANIERKLVAPTPVLRNTKLAARTISMTPLSNSSWKSGSDSSFLQKEKEINDIEAKINAITEEKTLENIAEISPPISTPFKEYRSVQEYFNNSSLLDNSALYSDNTIMCFDKPSIHIENDKREESVIVSLCDLFNKAAVTNSDPKENTELNNLLEMQKQAEQSIQMIESGIQLLNNIKESHIKSLHNIKRLIKEKQQETVSEFDKTLVDKKDVKMTTPAVKTLVDKKDVEMTTPAVNNASPIISRPCSVIKRSRSPSYKIPKKNFCLRKNVICKSMPNVSTMGTPVKDIKGEALNVYMKMKQQMNFLSTPVVNRPVQVIDTPAVTSHNLQRQLDKLYNGS